jgi:hypothetical protein
MSTLTYASTDGAGGFATSFTPRRTIVVAGVSHDCAIAGECRIGVGTVPDGAGGSATAEIQFDPSVPPPPPPSIEITPATGLLDDQSVVVTGEGFDPNQFVTVLQCLDPVDPYGSSCSFSSSAWVQASPTGTFTVSTTVSRVLYIQGSATDCAAAGACVILAAGGYPEDGAAASIQFDGSVPLPPPPTVTVTPSTDLLDGGTVSVSASGFDAGAQLAVIQCQEIDTGDASGCNTSAYRMVQADASGDVSTDFVVDRMLYLFDGTIDCATQGCRIVVAQLYEGYPYAGATLAFDASVPPPPPPTLVAEPATGLFDGQTVTVHGSGYPRNQSLGMAQCITGDETAAGCDLSNVRFVQTDATGSFTTTFTVHSSYSSQRGLVDCTVPEHCRIGAGVSEGGLGASALLTFSTAPTPTTSGAEVQGAEATAVSPSFTG